MSKQAINASRRSVYMCDPSELVIVGRDTDDDQTHPLWDSRAGNDADPSIVDVMLKIGVKKPVIVTKEENRLLVVDGRQRIINARACNEILTERNLPTIRVPVMPPEKGESKWLVALGVVLNEHATPENPMGRARRAQQLQNMGYSAAEIGTFMRCTNTSVKNYISLLDLPLELQELVAVGTTPATVAYDLARKGHEAQKIYLMQMSKRGGKKAGKKDEKKARPKKANAKPPKRLLNHLFKTYVYEPAEDGSVVAEVPPGYDDPFIEGILFATGQLKDAARIRELLGDMPEPLAKFLGVEGALEAEAEDEGDVEAE